ncbi:transcription factor IBH1-like [Durio zibethinus]|uniref:Transcription factor IBH1-like n=1 Tax=Durio zibethinus TaxID=66656 RepID=A0A6P6A483_DURZI|nr:transcription factor IBH1-like [Durio zibethinus]
MSPMNNPQDLNPSSLKSRFTTRFLRALTKINGQKPISSSSPREMFQRYRRIKVAADKSMAWSVRSRRTWSRAMLWKLRSRYSCRQASSSRRSSVRTSTIIKSRQAKTSHEKENKNTTTGQDEVGFVVQADKLRKLVPGGEAMDLCNLLGETAHYIKCLTTQVQVMRKIAHFYSL